MVHNTIGKFNEGKPTLIIKPDLFTAIEKIVSAGVISDPVPHATSTVTLHEMLSAIEWASFSEDRQRLIMWTELNSVKKTMGESNTKVDTVITSVGRLKKKLGTVMTTMGLHEVQTAAFRFDTADSLSNPEFTKVKVEEAASVTVTFSGPDGAPSYAISGVPLHESRPSQWQVEIVNPGGGFMVLGIIGKKRPTSSLSCYNSTCYGWSSGKYVYVGGSDKSQSGDLNPWDGWKMGDKGIFTYTPSHYTLSLQLLRGRMRKEFFIDNCVLDEAFIHFFFCFNGSTVRFSKDI